MRVFFIIGTSGSMEGNKIGAVNTGMREFIAEISEVSQDNICHAKIKIEVLVFSSGARWITTNGPVDAQEFDWTDLDAGGRADMGAAFKALNEKLSAAAFTQSQSASGNFTPVVFLFSDSPPTDDWEKELNLLKQKKWFKSARKAAVAIGDGADKDILKAFTGSSELVLEGSNMNFLLKAITGALQYADDGPAGEEPENEMEW
jgi:uncharacterized protein YegL